MPARVHIDGHDVRNGLAPRQFVRVMLIRPNEYDRTLLGRDSILEMITVVEFGGNPSPRARTNLSMAPVAPDPQKITISLLPPPTAA